MVNQVKHLFELYNQKRFAQIADIPTNKMLKIDEEKVTKVTKKNQSYLICTCESSGKTGHNSICRHKQFFIAFPILEFFSQHINKLLSDYKKINKLKMKIDTDIVISDLENLKFSK